MTEMKEVTVKDNYMAVVVMLFYSAVLHASPVLLRPR
ncbi:hypothetical protein E2C01_098055 [Portunus trituberculatus]|uniref:Uncharacterized protein n=1 Tax=Portunus trituberculatus TaxID=210409 RepID=A0A5B7K638_PORTR|nr:hypothetical protein [Portunus trituberculatus]